MTQTKAVIRFEPHAGQYKIQRMQKRFNVVACGRRWGKTEIASIFAIEAAGGGDPVAWCSPTYRMMLEVWRKLTHKLYPVTKRANASERRLELVSGGIIEFWSLENADTIRGRKYKRVIVDEAAMLGNLAEIWQSILRPTLADLHGDAWFFSTPKGRGDFWRLWMVGQDTTKKDWQSWQMPSWTNPHVARSEFESMRDTMPDSIFRQEILAEFIDRSGGVFRNVPQCVGDPEPSGAPVVIGVDWAKSADYSVFTVVDTGNNHVLEIDRFNQTELTIALNRLFALCERWQPELVVMERNGIGEKMTEDATRAGLPVEPFYTSMQSKTNIITELATGLERGDITIPDDPVLIGELLAFQAKPTSGGVNMTYSAPQGMHDDMVMSLALAYHGLGRGTGNLFLW